MNESSPLVSIIVRSLNRPTLAAALDSIARQTYGRLEMVVVAAAGAGHPLLSREYGGRRLRFLPSATPLRRSAAANAGLQAARGDLLGFLDDDDRLLPNHVDALVAQLEAEPQAIAAYSRVRAENGAGELLREFGRPFDAVALHLENYLPIHSVLFRRKVLDAGAQFDPNLDLCEDWDFWCQLALQGKFVFHDEVTAVYRIEGASGFALQGDPDAARAAERQVTRKWLPRLPEDLTYEIVVRARAFPMLQGVQAKADAYQFALDDIGRMHRELHAQHMTLAQRHERLAYEQEQLVKRHEGLVAEHRRLAQAHERLDFDHSHLVGEHEALVTEHQRLAQAHERLDYGHAHLVREHAGLLAEHQQLADRHARTQRLFEEERERLEAQLAATIADFEGSTSWRITLPLRTAGRAARLGRRALRGLWALDWSSRGQVLGWLLRGHIRAARRKLALASAAAGVAPQPGQRLSAAPETWPEPPNWPPLPGPVDILIPVYDGFDHLDALFDSLARASSTAFRLLICDDASPDSRVWPLLQERVTAFPQALLLRNAENLGFVQTINRLYERVEHDFVLLNTDVQVPRFWLERLMAPLLADPSIASVTPFTNAGTICSFPHFFQDCPIPDGLDLDRVDGIFAGLKDIPPPDLSTGVGFCMGIRLAVARQIGMFDTAFGRGYREENDWCRRAQIAGYRHVLAPNLFVHHKHGGSFPNEERKALADRNEVILRRRYPELFDEYVDYIRRDPVRPLREFLHLRVLAAQAGRSAFVIIDNVIEGGAQAYSRELVSSKLAAGIPVLQLIDDFRTREVRAHWRHGTDELVLHYESYQEWGRLLAGMAVEEVFLENIYSFRSPVELLDWLAEVPERLGMAVTVAIHDFFMLCPSLFLIDADQRYCDLPAPDICERCRTRLHTDFPTGAATIADWRALWGRVINRAARILVFSNAAGNLIKRVYPTAAPRIEVRPHSLEQFQHRPVEVALDRPLHIGIVGSISWHKGWGTLKAMCDEIERRRLPYRITVIGAPIPELSSPCLRVTGRYERAELAQRIRLSGANLFFFTSIWPETFSYVAHEIMACGVPFCCLDLGAPAEAARHYALGCVLPPQASAAELLEHMDAFRERLAREAADAAVSR